VSGDVNVRVLAGRQAGIDKVRKNESEDESEMSEEAWSAWFQVVEL
jgi:hypothetical protein